MVTSQRPRRCACPGGVTGSACQPVTQGKATKAAPKTAAKPKARAASGAATKKKATKVLKDHDDNALSADDMDFGVSDDDAPVKASQPAAAKKNKTASETYQKVS